MELIAIAEGQTAKVKSAAAVMLCPCRSTRCIMVFSFERCSQRLESHAISTATTEWTSSRRVQAAGETTCPGSGLVLHSFHLTAAVQRCVAGWEEEEEEEEEEELT